MAGYFSFLSLEPILSSTPENEEVFSLHPSERMYSGWSHGTWFKLASDSLQALISHHNDGKATKKKIFSVGSWKLVGVNKGKPPQLFTCMIQLPALGKSL